MVNVPPLLCSTPPPIDFGEDDDDSGLQSTLQLEDGEADEYSEYGLVTDTHTSFNAKVSELPELPISAEYIAHSQPPELSIGPAKTEKATVEAFNYQVKAADTEIPEGQKMSPKHIDVLAPVAELSELAVEVEQPSEVDDEEEEANANDNLPSLKLDSLSLYSSGSATPPSTLSPVADEQTTKAPPVCHQVTLEDVTDDSDDECSPKKPKELFIPEGAPDFFAIEIIATPTQQASAMNNQLPEAKPEPEVISTCKTNDVADSNEVLPQELNGKVDEAKSQEALSEDDDFGDFADFSAAPAVVETEQVANQDDGFDDFQDFVTPATTTVPTPEDDSDDDFGDFAEPTFESAPPAVAPALPQPPPPAAAHLSIDERVKPVLEIMFPKVESSCAQSAGNQRPLAEAQILHFGAIEQAHALNYQWSSSEMRHSLVRSLAIDSRNILFGDKWNASMPRFAANLSFDPLKPLKPQAAPGPNFSLLPASNNSSAQPPLQESHVQTLQLEQQQQQQLDQVMMVANADKINLVTSNYSHNNNNNTHDALDAQLPLMELLNDNNENMTINYNNNNNDNANANDNFLTHFATICNNNNHAITTTTTTTTTNTNFTAHCALPDLRLEAAAAASAAAATSQSQTKAQPSPADGQVASSADEATAVVSAACPDDGPAAASIFAAAAATAPLSPALSTDGHGNHFDDIEQLPQQQQQQQQQLDLRGESLLPSPSPSPPPALATAVNSQQLHEITSCNSTSSSISINNNNNNSFSLPLKETHIYTPSKSDTVVAKTTTLAPIDFDYEIASAGIIIDETVVKKEYRDVEYKPPFGLDSPTKPSSAGKPAAEDDDFSDFQSVPAVKSVAQLQPPRNGTPTFGEQMILSPAILLPQSIPLAKPTIEWGDNAQASINADELARIEELFSHQYKPPTISASVAQQSPKQHQQQQLQQQQKQHQEDDEWSDFVSVPVQQQQQQQQPQQIKHNNNNVQKARKATPIAAAVQKDDDWSDFVSSTPLPARAAPQFNSGAWQSANFYNNPLSLYQQQQQPHSHSNLVPKYQSNNSSSNNNNNSSNNNNIPQQIHMMHDFSTAPTPTGNAVSYQHQHHQHHQQQLQQQHHRQQFHLSNAKVAPRISLIPDLSFVAPALPANAGAFMSSLPKPSFSAKK
ncbi:probable nuclear hormone receptor HR38 isoform X1 [Drosophila mojavensis]|uniref:probable nuclear hormone receptor HR38 isoform X1 n=1 Tax=Drosophila mojavensis TaxID=7230 RepID=UPI001CD0948F|nr:probable nuclear hormone receptor HR38 isoform X1 [Drosophila mojavensis]